MFEMANLRPSGTGLPVTIYVSAKGQSRHLARIKVSSLREDKLKSDAMFVVTVNPNPRILGDTGNLTNEDLKNVLTFVIDNQDALQAFWDEEIDTKELLTPL